MKRRKAVAMKLVKIKENRLIFYKREKQKEDGREEGREGGREGWREGETKVTREKYL